MRRSLVAGNWKMNGTRASVATLVQTIMTHAPTQTDIALLAPFVFIPPLETILKNSSIAYGAQDVSEYPSGAYTGEVSGAMQKEFGCRYVIVGHSERRTLFGDTNDRVAKKFVAAQAAGLIPILCVGESLAEREKDQTEAIISAQLRAVFSAAPVTAFKQAVVAYEPVWAIGTGKTATPEQAQDVHHFIRNLFANADRTVAESLQIVYGGSVKASNAAALFANPDIDGGLIGGASLIAEDFLTICRAVKG